MTLCMRVLRIENHLDLGQQVNTKFNCLRIAMAPKGVNARPEDYYPMPHQSTHSLVEYLLYNWLSITVGTNN
jgi:hypothetical protein